MARRPPDVNEFTVDGQTVRVIVHVREGDGTFSANRLPSYRVFTRGAYRGTYFRIDRGESRDAPQAWYCRPVRLDVEYDAPMIGPFSDQVDAIAALLKCRARG